MYRPVYAVIYQELGEDDYYIGFFSSRKKAKLCIKKESRKTELVRGKKVRKYLTNNFIIDKYDVK